MGLRLLLVEDNPQNRLLAQTLLTKAGHEVKCCANGCLAFEQLRQSTFDLVLLDIQLPEMDGYEIARRLKADEQLRHIPLVAISSFAMPSERARAMDAGFNGYIEKPIEVTQFVQQVMAHAPKGER